MSTEATDTLDVAALIFRQAATTPDATAVVSEGTRTSYREFADRASRLAHHLLAIGAGPGSTVAVLLDRSVDQLVAALAVLTAGSAYLPLDPSYPAQRLSIMLDDARTPLLVTRSDLAGSIPGLPQTSVLLDRDSHLFASQPTTPPGTTAAPGDLAYVVFTSGSTGRPKGAMNTRQGLLNRLLWKQRTYRLTAEDAVLQKTPVGFDVSIWETFWPLLAGARTVVARPGGQADAGYLAGLIAAEHVTLAHFVPSVLRVFLDTADLTTCGSLRQVLVGGETLTADLHRRFFSSGLRAGLDNLYGPAEAVIDVTHWRCRPDWPEQAVPIGRPIDNTRIHLLDDRRRPVHEGTDGEVYIGGVQVGRGYLGRPGLTAERFVPDPFSSVPGARLYRTGDRARSRPDGTYEFLGRLDDQVKLRGVRIEPGEVEAALTAQPDVQASAVKVHGVGEDAKLIAYYVGDANPAKLRARLAETLPAHTVPAMCVPISELPLSVHGKLDRGALPEPVLAVSGEAARVGLEAGLAAMWGQVLGLDAIGRDVDVVQLGGNSLHAARVLARIRARYGTDLSLRELFAAGTVRALARLVDGRRAPGSAPVRVRADPETDATLLSPGQRRLWFLDHLSPAAGVAYNVPVTTRIRGRLDLAALQGAVTDVVLHHEQLRTSFVLDGTRLRTRVENRAPTVRVVDLGAAPDAEQEALRQAAGLAREHFDLGHAPLVRCAIFRLGPEDHLMTTVLHHMVADGWTVGIFDRELAGAYRARVDSTRTEPAGHPLGYRDFAQWHREFTESVAGEAALEHWTGQLAGAPAVLDLPADHVRPAVRSHRGRRLTRTAPAGLSEAIRELAAETRTTHYAVCLAAFGTLLREVTGKSDLVVASPSAGRPAPELEDVAGFFANTVLLRLRPDGAGTFRDLVRAVHRTTLDALEHQYVPFEDLVGRFAPAGDLSRPPLAQVAFVHQGPRRPHAALAGLTVAPVPLDNGTAKFDLTIEVAEAGDDVEVTVEYCTDLFEPVRAGALLDRFVTVLTAAVGDPAPADRQVLPAEPAPDPRCLHEVFADTAARWPDRIAVTDGTRSLTYAELDRAANYLAHRLRGLGAGPEQLVGLCAERRAELVVGVLAVLKASAAYLPLDPRHPPARLDGTLTDAGCRLLLGDAELCAPLVRTGRVLVPLDEPPAEEPSDAPASDARPGNAAYVIYTSGSTGKPKGVVVTHANAVRLFTATEASFAFGSGDVWTLFHSIAFDFSVWELWGALLSGARLVVVSHLTSRDPVAFLELLQAERVTVLNQTPTAFRQLASAAAEAGHPPLALRTVVFGGEALEPATLRGWFEGYGATRPRLVNMYGITETTVHVTVRPLGFDDLTGSGSPIGRPIGDLRVHVLDDTMAERPSGVEGEMYVGGRGVSRGYLHRAALSAERFVPDPFGPPGARLYRTGDLAVRHPDGELEFRGRADDQVKLHGFRIELGEIERLLLDQPGVRDAACVLREDSLGAPRLVAYLVPVPDGPADPVDVRAALQKWLPGHMVPASFEELPSLPLSANGKLDRARLPVPSGQGTPRAGSRTRPRTPAEHALAEVWSEVLGIDEPDVGDNFFAAGGDSIIAIRLGVMARAAGLPVTIERLFLHPTIAELAAACDQVQEDPVPAVEHTLTTSLPDLDPAAVPPGIVDAYPTAAMQLGILFECELAEMTGLYHDLSSVHLAGQFAPDALDRALAALCARHEILRTSFDIGAFREPMQFVHREVRVPVTVEHPAGVLDEEGYQAALEAWWRRELADPFDLGRPPLIRCHVLLREDESFHLSVSVHHIVMDGWSFAQLMTDLLLDYDREAGGSSAVPAAPAARYRDFVAAEQAAAGSAAARDFWQEQIGSAPTCPLPEPYAAGTGDEPDFTAVLPAELESGLRRVATELGLPLKSVFFAAHMWALRELSGDPGVTSGMQVNGRPEREGADRLLGLLLNIVPIKLPPAAGTWADLVRAGFAAERRIQPYRRCPLARIQVLAGRDRTLFDVVFNYTDFHVFDDLGRLEKVQPLEWWFSDRHSFPLMVEVTRSPRSGSRTVKVTASVGSPAAGLGPRLGELVLHALRQIAAAPQATAPAAGSSVAEPSGLSRSER
ncbi:amino acid adenylation domain-containing protein [Amycolatopsis sp. NPDC088138]|uniref:amino acid adenylation domain-containing protein n=1 Tax=Amycolatopsis sp. NPDC088138 TaxID=3363938 RepID=UPI0038051693